MRQALGRGLEALIPKSQEAPKTESASPVKIPIDKIRTNPFQPRKNFDPERLSELSSSIKEHGLAQPILVSFDGTTKTYELIAGERRLRAAELAGLKEIEAVVRQTSSDRQKLVLALIENLQRENLNAIESALGYLRLMKEFQISQSDLVAVVGKSKSAISNALRLLELPDEIQKAIQFEKITEGHARALMMVKNPVEKQRLFNVALEQNLSVRDLEDLARLAEEGLGKDNSRKPTPGRPRREKPADLRALEQTLQQDLGTKVEIKTKKDPTKGSITIHFYSLTDFDKIINTIKK